ncbi:DDE-type integrase/transposase/recombinase [Prauserella sp. ASG 168]|uniref:DDE-type integrase/transposase/recombinase n=1 Tax=Prauserella cavernicola TaxID=2800127 RepID=A0A934QTI1_9PSEU|nr:DDE-type integrase/transposase/recombinase [Prauserella cavernicola]
MRELGMNGVARGHKRRTTTPAKDGIRAGDKLNRDFTAQEPNRVWVADFTYVATWTGWSYVAFVIDAYSRAIVGWTASSSNTTTLVSKALNMALWRRDHYGHPVEPGLIHHSDAGSQYTDPDGCGAFCQESAMWRSVVDSLIAETSTTVDKS